MAILERNHLEEFDPRYRFNSHLKRVRLVSRHVLQFPDTGPATPYFHPPLSLSLSLTAILLSVHGSCTASLENVITQSPREGRARYTGGYRFPATWENLVFSLLTGLDPPVVYRRFRATPNVISSSMLLLQRRWRNRSPNKFPSKNARVQRSTRVPCLAMGSSAARIRFNDQFPSNEARDSNVNEIESEFFVSPRSERFERIECG